MDNAVEMVLGLAAAQAPRPALITRGVTWTYADLVARAGGVVALLYEAGFTRGQRVATLLEEYDAFFASTFGVWLAGGVVVPLNTSLPQRDLEWLVAKSQPGFLLLPPGSDFAPEGPRRLTVAPEGATTQAPPAFDPVRPDELAMIMFTSGTTGLPKGVCQTLAAIGGNAGRVAHALGLTADDRIFINTPPYFASGICHFLTMLASGGSLAGQQGFYFGPGLLDEMETLECTGFGGAPAHLVRVVEPMTEMRDPGRLRFWVSSGDHLPVKTIDKLRAVLPGVALFNMYGLTEVSGRLCILPPAELDRRVGSVGLPIADMHVSVRRRGGDEAPAGEAGEVFVAGPLVMQGYLDEPGITAAALTGHGFRTGDFGRRDEDGYLWIEGRKDDIVKRGGEKVSIIHVQQAMMELGLFAEVVVIAAADEILGHVPVAFVVPLERASFKRSAVMRRLKQVLPAAYMPSRIIALDVIPRTGSGKAIRAELTRLLAEDSP